MKYLCLVFLILGTGFVQAGVMDCADPAGFRKLQWPDWDKLQSIEAKILDEAPDACPGPMHPVLEAAHLRAQAWIHIVETNTGIFLVDVSKDDRKDGIPFYSRGNVFWDNPKWDPPSGKLIWTGYLYPVIINGFQVKAIAGLRWGFEWRPGEEHPRPLKVKRVSQSVWRRHLKRLKAGFSRWQFE